MPVADWKPTTAEVAEAIRSRTYVDDGEELAGGALAGDFTDKTRPTKAQVEAHITTAQRDILSHFTAGEVPELSWPAARGTAALKAALAVELSLFDGTAADDSPYLQLRRDAEAAEQALFGTAQVRDLFNEEWPPEEEEGEEE